MPVRQWVLSVPKRLRYCMQAHAATQGLKFGATHQANGYAFANAKDPDKNTVSISSRAFRAAGQHGA
jgi:hypothetical protein